LIVDAFLVIAGQRDTRSYADRPLPDDAVERILQAARVAGNARNRQERRFWALESAQARRRASEAVTRPGNVAGSAFAVAIVVPASPWAPFDAARAAQNMMIAAANDGIASCPNTVADQEIMAELLELGDDESVAVIVSFGYPARARDLESRTALEWLERADRLPLDEVVRRR
jgi:nitroreductase